MSIEFLGINVPDAKFAKFSTGFLFEHPNKEMTSDEIPAPVYTDIEWMEKLILDYGRREYRQGMKKKAIDDANIDNNVI